jgi:hypothetical protein
MRIRALAMKNKRRDMRKTKIRNTVAAIAALCLVSAMSRAEIPLEDFEGSINGSADKATVTFTNSTDFVTQGTQCAVVQATNSWYDTAFFINVNGAEIKNSATKRLLIDITAPVSSFEGGFESKVWINFMGEGLDWVNVEPSQAVSGADKQTFSFDYSSIDMSGMPENPSWFQVRLITGFKGPDGPLLPGPIYVDNMRLEGTVSPTVLPTIQSIVSAMDSVSLTWSSEQYITYRVLAKNWLSDPTWTEVTNGIVGAGSTTSATLPVTEDTRFYMVEGQ